jgi:hypothetical protein
MKGIYSTAIITTLVALIGYGWFIRRMKGPARWLWLAFLIGLPLQPLAFYTVRVPLDKWLAGMLGKTSGIYQVLTTFYAPLTEEAAKLVPLLLPTLRRDLRRDNFVRYALAIGLGFGIGEMWFIAYLIAHNPELNGRPFYQYGGYAGERLMVCLFHGAFVSVALWRWQDKFGLGVLGAMALHYFGNLPIFFMAKGLFGWSKGVWQTLVMVWLNLYLFGSIALLARFSLGTFELGRFIFGKTRCPECGVIYPAPLLGLNLGPRRYERCPHCRHWHLVGQADAVTEEA